LFRVLIIDDDRFNRRLYEDLLVADGLAVETVADAAEGLRRIRSNRPDLVVMDIEMPDLDGLEATRRLKADPETAALPVIIISAHALNEHERQALAVGDAFLRKPLRFPEFQQTIRRFAGGAAD
jgi:two-component system cell cycle response regulator DivK